MSEAPRIYHADEVDDIVRGIESNRRDQLLIFYRRITTYQLERIFKALAENTSIATIVLAVCKLADSHMPALCDALRSNTTVIDIALEDNTITDVGAFALSRVLKENQSIQSLHLSGNRVGDEGLTAICKVLASGENTGLRALNLKGNVITDTGLTSLCAVLKNASPKLTDFKFKVGCQVSDSGANAIASLLPMRPFMLVGLALDNNRVGNHGARAILQSLLPNFSMQRLYLRDNCIGIQHMVQHVERLFKYNAVLFNLRFEGNPAEVDPEAIIQEFDELTALNIRLHQIVPSLAPDLYEASDDTIDSLLDLGERLCRVESEDAPPLQFVYKKRKMEAEGPMSSTVQEYGDLSSQESVFLPPDADPETRNGEETWGSQLPDYETIELHPCKALGFIMSRLMTWLQWHEYRDWKQPGAKRFLRPILALCNTLASHPVLGCELTPMCPRKPTCYFHTTSFRELPSVAAKLETDPSLFQQQVFQVSDAGGRLSVVNSVSTTSTYAYAPARDTTVTPSQAFSLGTIHEIDLSEVKFSRGPNLGSGRYGEVYAGRYRGCDVAVKMISTRGGEIAKFQAEASLLQSVRHTHIVNFLGYFIEKESSGFGMVTELLDRSLYDYLHTDSMKLNMNEILRFSMHIASGLDWLHSRTPPIIHRDVKSGNILLSLGSQIAKIADLGLSILLEQSKVASSLVGTPHWMAPEIFLGDKYDEKVDVYSFGMVLYEMVTGKVPFLDIPSSRLPLVVAIDGQRPALDEVDPSLATVIERCWDNDSAKRPSMREVIAMLEDIDNRRGVQQAPEGFSSNTSRTGSDPADEPRNGNPMTL